MGTNDGTLGALNAQIRLPDRNLQSDIPFFPFGGAVGESAIAGENADRKIVAMMT